MENTNKQKWEDLNLTRDELKNIGQALQKEEFRSLLLDYVKEINDPENRKQYEKEITELENERGVDVKFVHPSSGYVIKTSVNGTSKAFINICSNSNVGKPSSNPDVIGGKSGLRWSIPYCLAPPREDVDKKNVLCTVYDVVFHTDTLNLSKSNSAFKKLVDDTALEAVEENFHVTLDKINVKFPKIQFKGVKHATVIRKKVNNFQSTEFVNLPNYPYPPIKEVDKYNNTCFPKEQNTNLNKSDKDTKYTVPKYTIKHRNNIKMQDYTNDPMSKMSITVPDELVIAIDLPLVKCSTDVTVDVTENTLFLLSENPISYKLNLKLLYPVDSNNGNAKFDIIKKVLTVTLPVLKKNVNPNLAGEDRNEGDTCYGRSNSVSSGDEDGTENEAIINKSDFDNITQKYITATHKILKNNVHYIQPDFTCQLINNVLTFTLNVPNVNPESVEYRFLNNSSGFQLSFMSMGTGFFPINYAICVLIPPKSQIDNDSFNVEVWDNNVIAQVTFISCDIHVSGYYVGTDESNIKKFIYPTSDGIESKLASKVENNASKFVDVRFEEDHLRSKYGDDETCRRPPVSKVLPVQSQNIQDKDRSQSNSEQNEVSNKLLEEEKELSFSESASSFDESTSSPCRNPGPCRTLSESHNGDVRQAKNRGILKISRSLSESNVDDYTSWSTDKTKKTVRFSDVISKQTFRMNSSILGQRKKNQRKMRNKKRAQERRFSESGGESEGEIEITLTEGTHSANRKNIDVWLKEEESSSCDISEVSDISESDDGQKEEEKSFMPCSSRKNHKRRGKKSARKHAATAKLQFMEN